AGVAGNPGVQDLPQLVILWLGELQPQAAAQERGREGPLAVTGHQHERELGAADHPVLADGGRGIVSGPDADSRVAVAGVVGARRAALRAVLPGIAPRLVGGYGSLARVAAARAASVRAAGTRGARARVPGARVAGVVGAQPFQFLDGELALFEDVQQ